MLIKNTVWLSGAQIVSKGLKFLLIIVATRILGPEQYGVFTYAVYLVGFFFTFSELGMSILLMREYQKISWDRDVLLTAIFSIRCFTSVLSLIAALFLYARINDQVLRDIFLILLFMFFTSAFRDLYIALARANNRMECDSIAAILEAIIIAGFGIPLLLFTHSLSGFVAAYALATLAVTPFIIWSTRPFRFRTRLFSLHDLRYLIVQGLPFLVANISLFLLTQIDVLMLKHFTNYATVGTYSAGLRIIQVLTFVPSLFIIPAFPLFSQYIDNKVELKKIAQTTLSLIFMISIPIAFGGAMLAEGIITDFFGAEFSSGIAPFRILIFIVPFFFADILLDYLLISQKRQFINTLVTLLAASLNFLLNIVFVPRFEGSGAAIASLISQFINMVITYSYSRRLLAFSLIDWQALLKMLAAASGMTVILFLIVYACPALPAILLILGGIIVYGLLLFLTRERTLFVIARRLKDSFSFQTNT